VIARDDLPIDITRDGLTIADVAVLPEDFSYELLDGKIHPVPPSLALHQHIVAEIVSALDPRARRGWLPTYSVSLASRHRGHTCKVGSPLTGSGRRRGSRR
jgi:hypothetical protein